MRARSPLTITKTLERLAEEIKTLEWNIGVCGDSDQIFRGQQRLALARKALKLAEACRAEQDWRKSGVMSKPGWTPLTRENSASILGSGPFRDVMHDGKIIAENLPFADAEALAKKVKRQNQSLFFGDK